MNPFERGQHQPLGTAHNPVIYFTDGSYIRFITEETEVGVYGTQIVYYNHQKGGKK